MTEMRIVAEELQFPEGPVVTNDGSVLVVEIQRETITKIRPDGTRAIVATAGGGPNGLAVGPDGALYLCNNGGLLFQETDGFLHIRAGSHPRYVGGRIERIDAKTGAVLLLYDKCADRRLCGPNDIVFDMHGGFYFTDLGKNRERDRDHGGVYYAMADGSKIMTLAYPMTTPNGIGLSPDGRTVYVAETETARLWAFDIEAPGQPKRYGFPSPHGGRLVCGLGGYQRFDSLAVAASGNICVATLVTGCITVISPEGAVLDQVKTGDPMTTNIAFGGTDMRTAYLTLSGTGRLAEMRWPEPGLKPEFTQRLMI